MYKNFLFDFDGTLADTSQGIIRTVQGTLSRMGLPAANPAAIVKTIGLPLPDCFRLATATPEARIQEATDIYREIFPALALEHISLFPQVLETLSLLHRCGIRMAIVSSRHHMSLDPLVKQLGIIRHIPLGQVFGEDEALRPKPAPDLALKVLDKMHLDAADTLVVGDTIYDLIKPAHTYNPDIDVLEGEVPYDGGLELMGDVAYYSDPADAPTPSPQSTEAPQ